MGSLSLDEAKTQLLTLDSLFAIEELEKQCLSLPQVDFPVSHYFGPDIYIREMTMPAGTLAIGHAHKFEHTNILLKGKILVNMGGDVQILEAPLIFKGNPGRKAAYFIEDTIWQNIHATELKSLDEIENHFIEKSDNWLAAQNSEGI